MRIAGENVCFIANFFKTPVFHEIAQGLGRLGAGVCWIVTKKEQYAWLVTVYPPERVLYLSRQHITKPDEPVGDFRLNELVYGDRVWKYEPENGLKFLTHIQRPVYDFLYGNRVRFVFGEITWAHELLVNRMARSLPQLRCAYFDCSLVRIPNRRIAFFSGEDQSTMYEFGNKVRVSEPFALERPSYLALNDRIVKKSSSLKGRLDRLRRFITGENIEKDDPNVIVNKATRLKVKGMEEYNRLSYARVQTVSFDDIRNDKYVFFGFHKQPEASIDVQGRYYENQAMNVINLWRMLPQNWKIVIKEHTNAIGDRSPAYYRNVLRYPGIVMVEATTDSRKLIEHSALVATVSGTIAYEAGLLGCAAITLSPVFFNRINYCRFLTLDKLRSYGDLQRLSDEIRNCTDNRLEFSNFVMENTFDGYICDVVTDAAVLEPDNIAKLVTAFQRLIFHHLSPTDDQN